LIFGGGAPSWGVVVVSLVENSSVALALIAAIVISASVRAPRRHVPTPELRRLLLAALALYIVGGVAISDGRTTLAIVAFAAGVVSSAFAAWLSRGSDQDDGPGGSEPLDRRPPPEPDGLPEVDWERFERELRDWARRREPAHHA
jgi:uncharacterized membrane protein YfcA